MEKSESEPMEPTKPPEIDPELNATAATAVEQWRNYQQAYAAYQQQYAAYQQYIQQRQYAQTVEQQQIAYSQYLEQHSQYQYQLQQYEQHHQQPQRPTDAMTTWGGESYAMPTSMMIQQPAMPTVQPAPTPITGYSAVLPTHDALPVYVTPVDANGKGRIRKRLREPRTKFPGNGTKSELRTKTIIYVNPEDETLLPADLKKLFQDYQCDLCRTRMNSHISANIHYQSKAHEKKINQWLKEYCAETGTPMPVRVRRQPELATEATAVGQSVFHCEACDLPLTSIQHANQHYTGKRHYMVVNGKKLPSGNGFYNAEGKWIRSGNIAPDQNSDVLNEPQTWSVEQRAQNKAKRTRLEPPPVPPKELITGVNWLAEASATSTNSATKQPALVTEVVTVVNPLVEVVKQSEPPPLLTINVESDDEEVTVVAPVGETSAVTVATASVSQLTVANIVLQEGAKPATTTLEQEIRKKDGLDCVDETGTFCLVCETSVTSRSEMLMHLKGAKHIKKARMKGMAVRTTPFNPTDTILKSLSKPVRKTDWSLYRMPSGKFYCKTCNLIVADEKLFGQHWYGKKHKLKMRQEQSGQQKLNGTAAAPVATANATSVVNPFASDDLELLPGAYTGTEAIGNADHFKTDKSPQKRFNRPPFFGKRPRFVKPRRQFPVTN